MSAQLPLAVALPDTPRWANFYSGPNTEIVAALRAAPAPQVIFLWGAGGAGKTHLLHAACESVSAANGYAQYLSLRELRALDIGILEDLEHSNLVCVDDVEAIIGDPIWEHALFHFFNRGVAAGTRLIFAARHNIAAHGIALADLRTRLAGGLVYHLRELDDDAKIAALQHRAAYRGLEFPSDAAHYLLRHAPRSTTVLFTLLERLDWAALAAQRRITRNFLRAWLATNTPSNDPPPGHP
ncbi:MAG: DnaA regulatory inactivator Hda [Pseudomonadota bacterium]